MGSRLLPAVVQTIGARPCICRTLPRRRALPSHRLPGRPLRVERRHLIAQQRLEAHARLGVAQAVRPAEVLRQPRRLVPAVDLDAPDLRPAEYFSD